MASATHLSHHGTLQLDGVVEEPRGPIQEAIDANYTEHTQLQRRGKRPYVLVGSALLQLPIWGELEALCICFSEFMAHICRIRHELWCFPRVLLQ